MYWKTQIKDLLEVVLETQIKGVVDCFVRIMPRGHFGGGDYLIILVFFHVCGFFFWFVFHGLPISSLFKIALGFLLAGVQRAIFRGRKRFGDSQALSSDSALLIVFSTVATRGEDQVLFREGWELVPWVPFPLQKKKFRNTRERHLHQRGQGFILFVASHYFTCFDACWFRVLTRIFTSWVEQSRIFTSCMGTPRKWQGVSQGGREIERDGDICWQTPPFFFLDLGLNTFRTQETGSEPVCACVCVCQKPWQLER